MQHVISILTLQNLNFKTIQIALYHSQVEKNTFACSNSLKTCVLIFSFPANVYDEFEEMLKDTLGDEEAPSTDTELRLHLRQICGYYSRRPSSPFKTFLDTNNITQEFDILSSPRYSSIPSPLLFPPSIPKTIHTSLENITTPLLHHANITRRSHNVNVTNTLSSNIKMKSKIESSDKSKIESSQQPSLLLTSSLSSQSQPQQQSQEQEQKQDKQQEQEQEQNKQQKQEQKQEQEQNKQHEQEQKQEQNKQQEQEQKQELMNSSPSTEPSGSRIRIYRQDPLCVTEIHYSDIRIAPTTGLTVPFSQFTDIVFCTLKCSILDLCVCVCVFR